jgi:hypothetical protein
MMFRNIWREKPWPYPVPGWLKYGLGYSSRNHTSRAFYPDARQRAVVLGGYEVIPFFMVYNYDLATRDVQDNQVVPSGDYYVCGMTANQTSESEAGPSGNFQSQLVEMLPNGKVNNRWSQVGVNDVNGWGTGQNPMILRFPYHNTDLAPLVQHMVNQSVNENVVQCVLIGYRRRYV